MENNTSSGSGNGGNAQHPNASTTSTTKMRQMVTPKHVRFMKILGIGIVGPTVPILIWWNWSSKQRAKQIEASKSKVRVPNVQTVDDLLIERCRPGDVILFDRRYETCSAGPFAALSCLLSRAFLCNNNSNSNLGAATNSREGNYDHCGIVVPGYGKSKKEILDPSNLLLLEATAGSGIVARPLLTRLEVSQSRSVILLPLAMPGERRYDDGRDHEPTPSEVSTELLVRKKLESFRDVWTGLSQERNYKQAHSTLGIVGSIAYAAGLHTHIPSPTSPSAWFVAMALMEAKIAQPVSDQIVKVTKVEDYLRDHRFQDHNVIHLRPGWRFLPPISMRET